MTELLGDSMLAHALAYSRLGWRVFRLTGYKTPFKGSHGFKDATVDANVIAAWWGPDGPNIGLATGWDGGGGPYIVVVDCDGESAVAEFKSVFGGVIPRTLCAKTSRGWHFYFLVPADVRIKSQNAKRVKSGDPGIDVKADKAYVILPPSINAKNGFVYQWLNWGTPIAEADDRLLSWHFGRQGLRRVGPPPALGFPAEAGALRPVARMAEQQENRGNEGLAQRALAIMKRGELPDFISALKRINAACNYDDWFRIGAAIYDFDEGELGLEIFKRWSASAEGYREAVANGTCELKWAEYEKGYDGQRVTVATVYALAREAEGVVLSTGAESPGEPTESAQGGGALNGHVNLPSIFVTEQAKAQAINHWPDSNDDGEPRGTTTNAGIAIKGLGVECRKDTFHEKLTVGGELINQWSGELSDDSVLMLRSLIKHYYGFDPGEKNTRDAAVQRCLQEQFNPVAEYLDSLEWDGLPRLGSWSASYLGADPTPLNGEFGRLMLVAAVRRIKRPGTKFDQIVVWEGREGTNKSTALKVLAGEDNFSDQNILAASDREQQEAVCGVWLYEIAELAGMRRADIERVKQFASRTEDRARPAYGRLRLDRKRQCLFVGTTNKDSYLLSDTGNRRFWPMRTGAIDVDKITKDRDQLWAEAVHVESKGGSLELKRELWADAGFAQDERREADAWGEGISKWLTHLKADETSVREVLLCAVNMPEPQINQGSQNRAARCLSDAGWQRFRKREGNQLIWRYKRGP